MYINKYFIEFIQIEYQQIQFYFIEIGTMF